LPGRGEFLTASVTVEDGRLCVLNVIRLSDVVLPERDAVNRAVARDKSGDVGGHPRDNGRHGGSRGRRCPSRLRNPARR